jgi:hypothetical protein
MLRGNNMKFKTLFLMLMMSFLQVACADEESERLAAVKDCQSTTEEEQFVGFTFTGFSNIKQIELKEIVDGQTAQKKSIEPRLSFGEYYAYLSPC